MRSSVNKLPSGRFRARYLDAESTSWISQTFDRQADAKSWLAGVRTAREAGAWVDPRKSRLTFAQWSDIFWPIQVGYKRKTLNLHKGLWRNHILPAWGDVPLDRITSISVAQWAAKLRDENLSASTIWSVYWLFHRMIRGALEAKYLVVMPFPARAPLDKPQSKSVTVLTAKEVRTLTEAFDDRYKALLSIMAYGGLRIGECCALRINDIDFEQGMIRVDEEVSDVNGVLVFERPKTAKGTRTVPLPWTIMNTLAAHVLAFVPERTPQALVFTSPTGQTLRAGNFAKRQFAAAVDAAGLPRLTPHELRHTAISTWIDQGADALTVAEWAGHASVATVFRVYGHRFPHRQETIRDRLDAALSAQDEADRTVTGFGRPDPS